MIMNGTIAMSLYVNGRRRQLAIEEAMVYPYPAEALVVDQLRNLYQDPARSPTTLSLTHLPIAPLQRRIWAQMVAHPEQPLTSDRMTDLLDRFVSSEVLATAIWNIRRTLQLERLGVAIETISWRDTGTDVAYLLRRNDRECVAIFCR